MNKDNLEEELQPFYEKGDCCSWIVKLRKECSEKDKEIERLNNIIDKTRRILGEYRHYSLPDEQQNVQNEAIVDEAYNQLHSNLKELKEGKE